MIYIYSKKNCLFCTLAKKLLKEKKLMFIERIIEKRGDKFHMELKVRVPEATMVPQIFEYRTHTGYTHIGGYDDLVKWVAEQGRLPVPNFSAGGIATPADAALLRQLGAESVFVGSGIFKSQDPVRRAEAIVQATTHFNDAKKLLEVSDDLGDAMPGIEIHTLTESERMQERGV